MSHAHSAAAVDIGRTLDHGPFSSLQKMVVLMAALSIILDGFDGQLIGFAIPVMMKEWGIARSAFAPAVATGLVGMAIGSAFAGYMADRIGRRLVIAASVALFGATTIAIGFAPNIDAITVLRFIAGLGIGGALPSASTLTAEFTPLKYRTVAVTGTIVSYPLGGMLAGLFASFVLPTLGWRAMFWIGGALPLAYSFFLLARLPGSPRLMARHSAQWPQLRTLLARMQRPTAADAPFVDAVEQAAGQKQNAGFGALFKDGLARDTLAIWMGFFMVMLASYSAFSWLPSMLTAEGLPVSMASSGLTAYNLGGVLGALGCAWAMSRFGSRWPLALACAGAAASALALKGVDFHQDASLLMLGLGVHGMFVNGVQAPMYALCAHVYATHIRATGTAAGLAFGRLGAILSSFAGAAIITSNGAQGYLSLLGYAMLAALVALFLVKHHIRGRRAADTPSTNAKAA